MCETAAGCQHSSAVLLLMVGGFGKCQLCWLMVASDASVGRPPASWIAYMGRGSKGKSIHAKGRREPCFHVIQVCPIQAEGLKVACGGSYSRNASSGLAIHPKPP